MPVVELFSASHCPHCAAALQRLDGWLADGDCALRRRDVLEHIDRAVALGIRRTPAPVVDDRLLWQGPKGEKRPRRLIDGLQCPG